MQQSGTLAERTLSEGRVLAEFIVQTLEEQAYFLLTTAGEDYLSLVGSGNLELLKEIGTTLRPISP